MGKACCMKQCLPEQLYLLICKDSGVERNMNAKKNRVALQSITEQLIGSPDQAGQCFSASQELYQLLVKVSGLDLNDVNHQQDFQLPSGKALSPVWAAHCALDFKRTRVFLRGILQAIEAMYLAFPHTQLHILYAGTGPFATIVLPLFPFLDPEKVQFTFLEISPQSIACLEKTLHAFGFEPWVKEIICADATSYQTDPANPPHIVVAEMLQAGLRREPQVAATLNLAPQMVAGGCLIPQNISVQAGLLHPGRNMERMTQQDGPSGAVFQLMGTVFELTKDTALPEKGVFDSIQLAFPVDCYPGFTQIALFTTIQVFGSERLHYWDSGLTEPVTIKSTGPEHITQVLDFQYQMGKDPGLSYQTLPQHNMALVSS